MAPVAPGRRAQKSVRPDACSHARWLCMPAGRIDRPLAGAGQGSDARGAPQARPQTLSDHSLAISAPPYLPPSHRNFQGWHRVRCDE